MLTANSLLLSVPAAACAPADTRILTRLLLLTLYGQICTKTHTRIYSLVRYSRIAVELSEAPLLHYLSPSPLCMSCPSYGNPSTPPPWCREEDCIEHQLGLQRRDY